MENFKITKKELIDLCLKSKYCFQTVICHPDRCSQKSWEEIENVLNSNLPKAVIERNLFLYVEQTLSFLDIKLLRK